jgi:hypothetical protein
MNERESLLKELNQAAEQTRKYGWRNYILAYLVALVSVVGSIAATILAAVQLTPGWLTATIAAIPAVVLTVNTTFNFERKALWHWRTTKMFKGLIRRLKYENATEAEVSQMFSEIDVKTFEGWTVFSNLSERDDEPNRAPSQEEVKPGNS